MLLLCCSVLEECRPLQAWQLHGAATLILCGSQIITENDGGCRGLGAGPKAKALTLPLTYTQTIKNTVILYGADRSGPDCKIKTVNWRPHTKCSGRNI